MSRLLLTLIFAIAALPAPASEKVVWQIGKPDRDWHELAIAGDYPAFARQFRKPVVFEVGRSDPARDWPFIQPGPIDGWSGGNAGPRTIRFELTDPPRGVYRLRIALVDVQKQHPPRLGVRVGDRTGEVPLRAGGGDESLKDPKKGRPQQVELLLPASAFKKGTNEIQLACLQGSWVQYDAVTLLCDAEKTMPAAEIRSLLAKATPLVLRGEGPARRTLEVSIQLSAPADEVLLKAEAPGKSAEVRLHPWPQFGAVTQELEIPDRPEPYDAQVTAIVGQRRASASVRVEPHRRWKLYLAGSSHTDIGYTHIQPECAERHNQNTDQAIDLMKRYPEFAWNIEVAWQAENYFQTRDEGRLADFVRFAKEGRLGVQALYANMLTGLCSHEQACRLTDYASQLAQRYHFPLQSAMITDVPTQEASLPMLLAASGIRYFSSGINNERAYTMTVLQDRSPCWWEGPDGSRILMNYARHYAMAARLSLEQSVEAARPKVLAMIAGYEGRGADYPYDAIFLHGAVSDNVVFKPSLGEVIHQWNQRYEWPKLIPSPNAEFFKYIEQNYGGKLPVVRGSAGTYWEDGAGSSARETTLCRNAHETTTHAEQLLALADRIAPIRPYPTEAIARTWRNCMLYDEHTWGAYCAISKPDSEFTLAQWKIKAGFAEQAAHGSSQLLRQALQSLARRVKISLPGELAVNPLGWPRSDVLSPKNRQSPEGELMLVEDVPACGYRTMGPKVKRVAFQAAEGQVLEGRFYRIEFDPVTGAITRILDKELNRELVDPKAPYRLNQYLYVSGGDDSRIVKNPKGPEPKLVIATAKKASLRRFRAAGLAERMMIDTPDAGTQPASSLQSTVTIYDDLKRIDIANRLTKAKTYAKEAVYFAFPFAARSPTFRYEIPTGVVNAHRDMLPGACLDWFTVQHFVEIEGSDATIAWATPDAPLVCFQDINRGKWQTELPMTNGHLYAYVMNNYWYTNYLAGQGGDFTFRFAITSRPKSDLAASARFGAEVSAPLAPVAVAPAGDAVLPSEPTSLVSVEEPGVMLVAVKQPHDGAGLVLRLWEVTGRSTTAHVRLNTYLAIKKATACDLGERPQQPLELKDGVVAVPLRASGLATVRLE